MIIVLIVLAVIAIIVIAFINQPSFGRLPRGARLERIERSPNYRNGEFRNQEVTAMFTGPKRSFVSQMLKFLTDNPPRLRPDKPVAIVKTDLRHLDRRRNVLVWFGHSSYLMQIDGVRYLVDPVFHAASPLSFLIKPFEGTDGYKPDDMPDIDYLIITHDHWDHLDYRTVKALRGRIGKVICPLGVGEDLEYWGYDVHRIIEMDWNEDSTLRTGILLSCLPARHFSGRSLTRNKTLWASYMLSTPTLRIFIGGDSGYGKQFAAIGKRFERIDLAILENGQYNADWNMIHTMPQYLSSEARELHAKRVLTVHHLKFALSKHPWDEPLRNVEQMKRDGINVLNPKIGEVVPL